MNRSKNLRILRERIERLPQERLANLPTPLKEAHRLARAVGGPRIFFKRDDLTGFPLSGNKTRMFEFSLAEAKRQGADTVIYNAGAQSNYCRQLAIACSMLGLSAYLPLNVMRGDRDLEIQGNLLLSLLVGAEVELLTNDGTLYDKARRFIHRGVAEKLRKCGRRVYVARDTERDVALEAVGYVNCALELLGQLEEAGETIDYIVLSSCDTTQAGLLVGAKYLGTDWVILGISPLKRENTIDNITRIANNTAMLLEIDVRISAAEVLNTMDYVGEGYGIPAKSGMDAIQLVANREGILLDPIYTGKAMAGLIDYIQNGKIEEDKRVVFLHTGGWPALFVHNHDFHDLNQRLTVSKRSAYLPVKFE